MERRTRGAGNTLANLCQDSASCLDETRPLGACPTKDRLHGKFCIHPKAARYLAADFGPSI